MQDISLNVGCGLNGGGTFTFFPKLSEQGRNYYKIYTGRNYYKIYICLMVWLNLCGSSGPQFLEYFIYFQLFTCKLVNIS